MRLHTAPASTRPKLSIRGKSLSRQFTTTVAFQDGVQTIYISRVKLDAIMQMLSPGQHVIVDNANGCKWTLACHNVNVFSLSCTKNAEQGVRCLVHGAGMSVVCKELHPNTREMLLYASNQILPCFNVCQNVANGMKSKSLSARSVDVTSTQGRFVSTRTAPPRIFAESNGGIISRTTQQLQGGVPECCIKHASVAMQLYLAALLCATAPKIEKDEEPVLFVVPAMQATTMPQALARELRNERLQPKHVSVLIKDSVGLARDDNGMRRFVCYVRLLVADSTAGNLVHDLVAAKLGKQAMRTPLLIITGPYSNNFAVVFPGDSPESIAEGHSIVSSSLAHFHL